MALEFRSPPSELESARALLVHVYSASKVLMMCQVLEPRGGYPLLLSELKVKMASARIELCGLLGFLRESNALALNIVTNGEFSFVTLKELVTKFSSNLKMLVNKPDDISLSKLHLDLEQLLQHLSEYRARFRSACSHFDQLIAINKSNPFSTPPSYDFLQHALCSMLFHDRNVDFDTRSRRIAIFGANLGLMMQHFGKIWVNNAVGQGISTVSKLREIQVDVLRTLATIVEAEGKKMENIPILQNGKEFSDSIWKEVERSKSQRFCVAFCGMTKAGKSLFINGLTGKQLLPSDELPATAWPCRLRHDPDAHIPKLVINARYFDGPLEDLQERKIGSTMTSYTRPEVPLRDNDRSDDDYDDDFIVEDLDSGSVSTSSDDDPNGALYHVWKDLHECTKKNLMKFEQPSFRLPAIAEGEDAVLDLLVMINDVVRLCRAFKIRIPEATPNTWPSLYVEFESLRDATIEGTLEFIDLPGLGEAHNSFHDFEQFVRLAALEADAIVPVLSFKEAAYKDWHSVLPQIVQVGFKRPPEFILCTHMDQVQDKAITDLISRIGKAFWSQLPNLDKRILRCSSRMGLGARILLALSREEKPSFENVWKENEIMHDCVEIILGASMDYAKDNYGRMAYQEWIDALQEKLESSRLQDAMTQLTSGIVNNAKGTALQSEGKKLMLMTRKFAAEKKRQLTEIARSTEEFERAYALFQSAREKVTRYLDVNKSNSIALKSDAQSKLDKASATLEGKGRVAAILAIESAVKAANLYVQSPESKSPMAKLNEIQFENKYEVEEFFYTVQDLMGRDIKNKVIKDFVGFVRKLADQSRLRLFNDFAIQLSSARKEKLAPPELVADILDKLNIPAQDVEVLFSARIKSNIVRTDVERHNVATAYSAIKNVMSKPFMHHSPSDAGIVLSKTSTFSNDIAASSSSGLDNSATFELGFMIRAPIAVLATVPLLLGSLVWPWLSHRRKLIVDKDMLVKHLMEQIQKPYFSEIRKEAEQTIESVITRSSQFAQEIVNTSLDEEQARFDRENTFKNMSSQDTMSLAIESISAFWRFSAVEKGLEELQRNFKETLQISQLS